MDTRTKTLAALGALALTAGCAPRYVVHAPASMAWVRVTPPGTGIAAEMPGQPNIVQERGVEDDGTGVILTSVRSEMLAAHFGLIVAEFEGGMVGDPIELARTFAEGMIGQLDLDATRAERLDVPGFYARQDVATHREGVVIGIRQFVGARRVYVAIAAVPAMPEAAHVADHFLSSIELDPGDRLYAAATEEIAAWSIVYNPGDDFAVEMPAVAEVRTSTLRLPAGEVHQRSFEARGPDGRYLVRVIGFGDRSPDGSLDEVATALGLGEASGPVQASGFPGRAHRRSRPDGGTIESRIFRTAGRVYVLETTDGAATRFFDSFRIL